MGGFRREQDGGCFSLDATEISIEQPRHMYFCAPKYARGRLIYPLRWKAGFCSMVSGVLKREERKFV